MFSSVYTTFSPSAVRYVCRVVPYMPIECIFKSKKSLKKQEVSELQETYLFSPLLDRLPCVRPSLF